MQHMRSTIEVCRLCGADAKLWVEVPLQLRGDSRAAESGGRTRKRRYMRCPVCDAIQCHSDDLPSPEEEQERYDEHNNDLADRRYRTYLEGFIDAAVEPYVRSVPRGPGPSGETEARSVTGGRTGPRILDFGSGPQPALAHLLEERGYRVSIYDPFFAADEDVLDGSRCRYDGITAVEVVEHLFFPGAELNRLASLMGTGGVLAVRTGIFAGDTDDFRNWWYRRDISHVFFWTDETVRWTGRTYGLEVVHRGPGEILVFRRLDNFSGNCYI
jgi:hypothetical protein